MPKNAAIYIADPSMLGSRLFDSLDEIKSYQGLSEDGNATGFKLTFGWGTFTMNLRSGEGLEEHLNGFRGFVDHTTEDQELVLYTISRITYVRMLLGCVITHESDAEKEAKEFLHTFNRAVNGLLFLENTVWDWTGDPIAGSASPRME